MGIIRSFLRDLGYVHESNIRRLPTARRAYASAQMGRLTADWITAATSIDHDIRAGLVTTRNRSRDLSQNNEIMKAYLRAVKRNVVGSEGFTLQIKSVDYKNNRPVPDSIANKKIEQGFKEWSKPAFSTVRGTISFRKLQEVIVETVARDGEIFVRMIYGERVNKFGFTLQVIEPDWIDVAHNADLGDGRIIRMGVELDTWRRPVAYYVSTRNNTLDLYGSIVPTGPYMRFPASTIIHVYDPERADQTRGMPWCANTLIGLHNLKGYDEAAVVNARVGAGKMGFMRDPVGPDTAWTGDTTDEAGNPITTVEPGVIEDIGAKEFVGWDPTYPHAQYDPFTKSILRRIASGLGVSYATITGDLSDVNYSSIRAGLIEERENWKSTQAWFIEMFLDRVYSEWLSMALMTGAVNLPATRFGKFNQPKWTGRRWAWVDPQKDVEAAKAARAAGFKSTTQIINEMGGDIEDVYQEIAEENALAESMELEFDYGGKNNGAEAEGKGEGEGEGAGEGNTEGGKPAPANGSGEGKPEGEVGRSRVQ